MTQQQQSREFDVSDLSSIPKEKNLTRFQVPREGLFDMLFRPLLYTASQIINFLLQKYKKVSLYLVFSAHSRFRDWWCQLFGHGQFQ